MYKTGNERGNYGCIKSLILIKILALTKVRIIPLERKKKKTHCYPSIEYFLFCHYA